MYCTPFFSSKSQGHVHVAVSPVAHVHVRKYACSERTTAASRMDSHLLLHLSLQILPKLLLHWISRPCGASARLSRSLLEPAWKKLDIGRLRPPASPSSSSSIVSSGMTPTPFLLEKPTASGAASFRASTHIQSDQQMLALLNQDFTSLAAYLRRRSPPAGLASVSHTRSGPEAAPYLSIRHCRKPLRLPGSPKRLATGPNHLDYQWTSFPTLWLALA
jgi:hypothetical protein